MKKEAYTGAKPRIEVAPFNDIRPGSVLDIRPCGAAAQKYERLIAKRGNIVPVTATYGGDGTLVLVGGGDAFSVYRDIGAAVIPVVVAETADEGDALMLMLEMSPTQPADNMAVSSCLCRLIDEYHVPRATIARTLGKSLPWLSMVERVGRRLSQPVKDMLYQGVICMRAAEEIALLPADIQKPFADCAVGQALNKEQVRKWVALYLKKGRPKRDGDAMLRDPLAYLNADRKKTAAGTSGYSRFTKAFVRCKTALLEIAGILNGLPGSALDDACDQIRELVGLATNMTGLPADIFTRVNTGVGE
jgi:ParB-like chromosome segregation protein Spo0J